MVAKEISLASNNAGVLAVRAGSEAAGFGALAEFLDQLARKIIQGSNDINQQAMQISKSTSNSMRTKSALARYKVAQEKGADAQFIASLQTNYKKVQGQVADEHQSVDKMTQLLRRRLSDLKQELDVGKVLASMSLVEASQSGQDFTAQLSDNAKNISSAIERIEVYVVNALSLLKKVK